MNNMTLSKAKQIASRIHSKYKEDSKPPTGNQNCQLCTWCAEAQFRGIDILPRPIYSPRDPALSSEIKGPTIVKSPVKIKIRNKAHIVSTVKDNPGSRYYIHVKWNDGPGGHEFLIINIDSNVYIMDAQQGLVESIDKTKYFDDVDYSGSYFARLDNKELDRALLNNMNSMKTLVPWDWDKDVEYMKKHGMLGEDEDIRFIRYYVPSDKATEYLKKDPELKQYWETLNKETNGEILVDPNTKEQIGYGFVYKSGKNKGFIFNIEVMKKFRRQGFGTIILNDCVTKFGGVDLTVACDNEGAIKLYLKYGFEIVETVKGQNGRDEYYMKLKKSKTVQEGADMITQEFDPLKLYSAINKTKTEYRDKQLNIGNFDRVPLNRATADEYNEGHGPWVTGLNEYTINDDDFEGTILVDENGICPGYLVIEKRDDTKWIVGVESSMDYKSFAIVAQLIYLARTEYEAEHAVAPKTNKALIECYLDNGWVVSNENSYLVILKYEEDDEDDEDDHEDVITEYMMEFSTNKLMFHVSDRKNLDGQVFRPRVPEYLDPYDPKDTGFENNTTARVCFAPTIDGALNAITVNVQPTDPVKFDKMYVYIPEKPFNQYKHKTNKEIIRDKDVYDANVTGEAWILEPVRLRLYGVIHVDQNRKVKRKKTVPTSENKRGDRNVFSYRWHWLVKPKVISSTVGKVKYDAMTVCDMVARDLHQFKYGLIVAGKEKKNPTESDYVKYWKLQSPEQFEQSRVGICYDFTEWEAGYLDTYYVKYKKYFISATYGEDKASTHTFIVVPDNGKYIYIEGAFKRIADEIHHMKVFDKLEDIFEYIVECMVELDNVPEYGYGVWDYTDKAIKPGTDIKHFQEEIYKEDILREGNVKRKKE